MYWRDRRLYVLVAVALVVSLLPLGVFGSGTASAHSPQRAPRSASGRGSIYFYCTWQGNRIRLKHVPTVAVERLHDAGVVGTCRNLRTNDRAYARLTGKSINVFVAPREYPGKYVVHNGRQGKQPILGTWTFQISTAPSAVVKGTVTDASTKAPVVGATVQATHCASRPTLHCAIDTDVTNRSGKYTIRFFKFGNFRVTVAATGYQTGGSATVKVKKGHTTTLNLAVVHLPSALTLALAANPSTLTVNGATSLTATLSGSVSDGTVTFTGTGPNGATFTSQTCTPANGVCSVIWTPTVAGAWSITAKWSGDTTHPAATNTVQATVVGLTTALALATNNTQAVNQSGTITATLAKPVADGTITFTFSGPNNATAPSVQCTPVAGACAVHWQPSAAGQWTVTANWSGDSQYAPAAATTQVTATPAIGTVTLTVTPNPTTVNSVTALTATVRPIVDSGTVTFTATAPSGATFATKTCTPVAGICTVLWQPTAAGSYTINGSWSNGTQTITATATPVTVNIGTGTMTLAANPNPVTVNGATTITATLNQPVNDGTITFTGVDPNSANVTLASCTPINGKCTTTLTPNVAGTWTITGFWSGDAQFSPVTATTAITAGGNTTGLTLASLPSSIRINHTGTLTATLGAAVSTGTITFTATGPSGFSFPVKTCTPVNGTCTVTWTPNVTGQWTISASWPGDTAGHGAAQQSTAITVAPAGYLTLAATPNPDIVNQADTISASLASPGGTGLVFFQENGPNNAQLNQSCTLNSSSTCSTTWTPTSIGIWTVTVTWSGDGTHPTVETDTVPVLVTGLTSTLSLATTPLAPNINQSTTVTATLNRAVSDGTITFTGKDPNGVSFTTSPASCVPVSGACSATWTPTTAGTWTVTANWSGDSQYAGSSATFQVTVNSGVVTLAVNPTSPAVNTTATITAGLTGGLTGGQITFTGTNPQGVAFAPNPGSCDPASGTCSVSWTPNMAGTWTITATWSGISGHPGSSSTIQVTVGSAGFSVSASPNPVHLGSPVTLTANFAQSFTDNNNPVYFYLTQPNGDFGGVTQCLPNNGTCSANFTPQNVTGTWTIEAIWANTANNTGEPASTQATTTLTVQ